ncbi:MAG TPA: hypothetical protein VIT67_19985 [Povalibacter sp.]
MYRSLKARIIIGIVAAVVVLCGLGGIFLRAMLQVRSGHGLDTYSNVYLMQVSYLETLTAIGAFAFVLAVGLLIRAFGLFERWRFLREVRRSREKGDV